MGARFQSVMKRRMRRTAPEEKKKSLN